MYIANDWKRVLPQSNPPGMTGQAKKKVVDRQNDRY